MVRTTLGAARRLAALLLVLTATGCMTAYFSAHVRNEHVVQAGAAHGNLVGSIAVQVPGRFSLVSLHLRKANGVDVGFIHFPPQPGETNNEARIDYAAGDLEGAVFHVPLPPGEYAIFRYSMGNRSITPAFMDSHQSDREFSIPFEIRAGATTYIGEYALRTTMRDAPLGRVPAAFFFEIRNRLERDLALAEKAGRKVIRASVIRAVPDPVNLKRMDLRAPD